jgi:hypothetical protein
MANRTLRIDRQVAIAEARSTRNYVIKVRLNALTQLARGKSAKEVARQVKSRPEVVLEWASRYLESGYLSLAH